MADTMQEAAHNRLQHFPITFFAIVMGLSGLTLALHAASPVLAWAEGAAHGALWFTLAVFALVSIGYLAKAARYPQAVMAEWNHPVRIAFFPAISISFLLIAVAILPVSKGVGHLFWVLGTGLQAVLTLFVISAWIGHRPFQHPHLSPAWFIPAVGNVIVPVAGMSLGYVEVSWLFFSAGMIFWIVLLTLVMNRLIFHDPLPGKLQPTLMILIAPPAVAFVAYLKMTGGGIDPFARILLNAGYVFAAIVLMQVPKIIKLPFAISFWALTFPVAALAIASFRYGDIAQSGAHLLLGQGLLAILVIVILALLARTALGIARGEICQPE